MNERITDIEMHLMHQENAIHELNEVVTGQQGMIEKLQADVGMIMKKLQTISPSAVGEVEDGESPPRY